MSIRIQDVLLYATGECVLKFGALSWRTAPREDTIEVHARNSLGYYIDKNGVLKTAGREVPRIQWEDTDGDGIRDTPFLLVGPRRTNLCLESEDLGTTWAAIGSPTRSAAAHTAAGVSLDLIGDDDASVAEGHSQVVAFAADGVQAVSVFVKEGTSAPASGSEIIVRDTTAALDRMHATYTWSGGVPTVVMSAGTEVRSPEKLKDGVYRLHLATAGVVAANTNQVEIYPCRKGTVADTGNVYIGGIQVEDATAPGPYMKTTTTAFTGYADDLYFPYLWLPMAATVLIDMIQTVAMADAATVLRIGGPVPSSTPRLAVESDGTNYRGVHASGAGSASASLASAPSLSDRVELLLQPAADGSVKLEQSLGQATPTSAVDATTVSYATAWAGRRLYLGPGLYRAIKVVRGAASWADMRAVFS